MTKPELLRLVRLLSAIESWGLSQEKRMPDYLHDDLSATIDAVGQALLGPDLPPNAASSADAKRSAGMRG